MAVRILNCDVLAGLAQLPGESVHCVVTSPPYYGLRSYNCDGQIGLEPTLQDHLNKLVEVFREVRRVLRPDGTVWLNYGDMWAGRWGAQSRGEPSLDRSTLSGCQIYAAPKGTHTGSRRKTGIKPKNLCMAPHRLAIALQEDGWYVRADIVWHKPNPMPTSVLDRPTAAKEYVFLLSKKSKYFYDAEAIKEPSVTGDFRRPYGSPGANELDPRGAQGKGQLRKIKVPGGWDVEKGAHGTIHRNGRTVAEYREAVIDAGRNCRDVWVIATESCELAHFAMMPTELARRCIKAGTSEKGCCAKCGAPWKRETKAGFIPQPDGWSPSCACNADAVACTVLDPFGGAGTTGLVADRLGRDAILIEINPEYAEMARRRIERDAGLFADAGVTAPTVGQTQAQREPNLLSLMEA
jgi:DNA modification methylase